MQVPVLFLCTISLRVKPFPSEFHNKEQTQSPVINMSESDSSYTL